jgi:hypothetical protein
MSQWFAYTSAAVIALVLTVAVLAETSAADALRTADPAATSLGFLLADLPAPAVLRYLAATYGAHGRPTGSSSGPMESGTHWRISSLTTCFAGLQPVATQSRITAAWSLVRAASKLPNRWLSRESEGERLAVPSGVYVYYEKGCIPSQACHSRLLCKCSLLSPCLWTAPP